jgi:hypothetical protein
LRQRVTPDLEKIGIIFGQKDAIGLFCCDPALEHLQVQEKGAYFTCSWDVAVMDPAQDLKEV